MGLPTQPLTLSTVNLATLQARQSAPLPPRAPAAAADGDAAPPQPTPAPTGRGRLVDIIA